MKTILVLFLAFSATALAQQPGPIPVAPSVELRPALDRVLRDYERAWRARDPEALAGLFTEDGFVLGNGSPPVRGRAAIREAYAKSGGPLSLRALAFATEGRVGYIIGGFGRAPGADPPRLGEVRAGAPAEPRRTLVDRGRHG